MIFSGIIKNWKLVLDIVIVLGIIFLVFWWNPFNLFGTRLSLNSTANMVSKIRDIGELVTAEYYGEVLASDDEERLKILNRDSIKGLGEQHYRAIKAELFKRYKARRVNKIDVEVKKAKKKNEEKVKKREEKDAREAIVRNSLKTLKVSLPTRKIRESTFLFVGHYEHGAKIKDKKYVKKDEDARYVERIEKEVLELEYDRLVRQYNGDQEFKDYDKKGFGDEGNYPNFLNHFSRLEQPKKERKIKLAMIGRGSVKAGFRFDHLDERNLVYDENSKTVYFFGFNAEILNADINPWFIPEKSIPGFEILTHDKAKFGHVRALKIHCIEMLKYNAMKADILKQAQKNGEEAMREFFSLILGEEIKKVVFKKDPLPTFQSQILDDEKITEEEVQIIDSLIIAEMASVREERNETIKERRLDLTKSFIDTLKTFPLVLSNGGIVDFNYTTKNVYEMMQDEILSIEEVEEIKNRVRRSADRHSEFPALPEEISIWYDHELDHIQEYNQWIRALVENGVHQISETTENELKTEAKKLKIKTTPVMELSKDSTTRANQIKAARDFEAKTTDWFIEVLASEIRYFRKTLTDEIDLSGLLYPVKDGVDFLEIGQRDSLNWNHPMEQDSMYSVPLFTSISFPGNSSTSTVVADSIFTDWTSNEATVLLCDPAVVTWMDTVYIYERVVLDSLTTSVFELADSSGASYLPALEVQKIREYLNNQKEKENPPGPVMRLRKRWDEWVSKRK